MQRASRLKRELQLLSKEPPPGITCWQNEEQINDLRAQILGGSETPYEGGIFSLEIKIPERYPFEPPKIRFLTPVYHPNIDNSGRICLDALKLPPKGAWKPSLNISTVLTAIQLLMAEPNPDDPLMADISSEFKHNKQLFIEKAKKWTQEHAFQKNTGLNQIKGEEGKELLCRKTQEGVMDMGTDKKEKSLDQKRSSPKREAISMEEGGEKLAKRNCM